MNTWDAYAPFYDWENALTMGRRDVRFWQQRATDADGPVLELGCGTGRILMPIARSGVAVTGIDASSAMLARARARARRLPARRRPSLIQGDLRALPFQRRSFAIVIAAYGVLQSLTTDADLDLALTEAARVLPKGGAFGLDLVPDLTSWPVYERAVRLRGRMRGRSVTLVESVRQDRRRGLTVFDETFVAQTPRGRRRHTFSLTFRTVPMDRMIARVEKAGFEIRAVEGNYRGGPWTRNAETWMIRAVRR